MAKKIVINNDFVQQSKSHITNLFRPPYNPFNDRPITEGGLNTNHFALQQYNYDPKDNPVATMYNTKNIITNLFLVTEDFITFMNRLNSIWAADTLPRVMTKVNYQESAANGYRTVLNTDTSGLAVVMPLVKGPTGNKATHFQDYETFAAKGLWGSTLLNNDSVGSSSIQELMLRYLYSLDARKRDVAFQIAELYYGITNSECVAAKLGYIPAKDFNSDKFLITVNNDEITMDYADPIEFLTHYDELIHNPNNKKLYLYFPYVTSNAMRAKADPLDAESSIGTVHGGEDKLISLYTGQSGFDTNITIPANTTASTAFTKFGQTFVLRDGPSQAGAYGNITFNSNMPVLTNLIWSKIATKFVNQAAYTVIQITETGGGGDITFDHTDKIDFIDSLKFVVKAPTVFS